MKYYVTSNKKYRYVRVYNVVKKMYENSNMLSRFVSDLVDKFIIQRKKTL